MAGSRNTWNLSTFLLDDSESLAQRRAIFDFCLIFHHMRHQIWKHVSRGSAHQPNSPDNMLMVLCILDVCVCAHAYIATDSLNHQIVERHRVVAADQECSQISSPEQRLGSYQTSEPELYIYIYVHAWPHSECTPCLSTHQASYSAAGCLNVSNLITICGRQRAAATGTESSESEPVTYTMIA